ncbi:hypothetical protein B0H10DRAFT_1948193 [Mycena sp. CBHHK59/15]|nr:hypothetical protein B0H10DRAFT_1948193 [Mycena sp. CBHHK59/15]
MTSLPVLTRHAGGMPASHPPSLPVVGQHVLHLPPCGGMPPHAPAAYSPGAPAQALLCGGQGVVVRWQWVLRRQQDVVAWVLHNGQHVPTVGDPICVCMHGRQAAIPCAVVEHRSTHAALPVVPRVHEQALAHELHHCTAIGAPAWIGLGLHFWWGAVASVRQRRHVVRLRLRGLLLLLWRGLEHCVAALLHLHALAQELVLRDCVVLDVREGLRGGLQERTQMLGGIRIAVFGGLGSRDVRCGRKDMENSDLLIPRPHLMQLLLGTNPHLTVHLGRDCERGVQGGNDEEEETLCLCLGLGKEISRVQLWPHAARHAVARTARPRRIQSQCQRPKNLRGKVTRRGMSKVEDKNMTKRHRWAMRRAANKGHLVDRRGNAEDSMDRVGVNDRTVSNVDDCLVHLYSSSTLLDAPVFPDGGLLVHTKEGCNPVVTTFFGDQDQKIARRLERSPTKKREPESRTLASPPTSSALSRVLPVGVPIDFWTPQFYNEELDLHEKAMYVNTGVAFPLPQFCTTEHHKDWYRMNAKDFMVKYGNDVLVQYNILMEDKLAGLPSESADKGRRNLGEEEETDLEDTEDGGDQMED